MEGGAIPELTFPGVLALTRGLLQTDVPEASALSPEPGGVAAVLAALVALGGLVRVRLVPRGGYDPGTLRTR